MFRVINDQVLVRRSKRQELSRIIATPETALEKAGVGTVLRVGEGKAVQTLEVAPLLPGGLKTGTRRVPLACEPGDRVVFTDWGGEAIKLREGDEQIDEELAAAIAAGDEVLVIPESYVLAVVQGEGEIEVK